MTDTWFAWYPVRTGALATGRIAWMERLSRSRCCGVTIYQGIRKPHKQDPFDLMVEQDRAKFNAIVLKLAIERSVQKELEKILTDPVERDSAFKKWLIKRDTEGIV